MYIRQINPHGGDVFDRDVRWDFSSNINPRGMPQAVKDAIKRAAAHCEGYPDPYCRRLRAALAVREGVAPDCILCSNGAAELIYSFAFALPKDRPVLLVSPTFCEYQAALSAAGIAAEHDVLSEQNGFVLTESFLKTDFHHYSAVILCTPNNPTGVTVAPDILYRIAETGVRMLVDMCFLELSDMAERYALPRLLADCPNVTVLKAFTKSYAMAGVRLGYAMNTDGVFLERMARMTQCWNVSAIAQEAGIAALDCEEWLRRSVTEITSERERMTQALRSYGVKVFPSRANYLLLYTERDLYRLLSEHRILVRDCANYTGLRRGYYRVAVRTKDENDRLLAAIKEVMR